MLTIVIETLEITMIIVMLVGIAVKVLQLNEMENKLKRGPQRYADLMSKVHEAEWRHQHEDEDDDQDD